VLLALLFRWTANEKLWPPLTLADRFLIAYVVWCYVASAWTSPDPHLTLRWALLNNLAILPYFLIRVFVRDERTLRWAFKALLAVGITECAYALICSASRHLFGTSFGADVGQYSAGFEGVHGTQAEANILGSYSACLAIMLLALYFSSVRKPAWLIWATAISLAALLVSLSRAAVLSFAFASIVLIFLGLRKRALWVRQLLPIAAVLTLLALPIVLTSGKNLAARFANLSQGGVQGDTETIGRLVAWAAAVQDIWQHPLAGNGIASFQLLADVKQWPILGDQPWVGNSIVRIVHDTGLIGLFLFLGVMVSIGRDAKRMLTERHTRHRLVVALAAGCIVYAVAFLSTEATILGFFWVHIGLLASACSLPVGAKF